MMKRTLSVILGSLLGLAVATPVLRADTPPAASRADVWQSWAGESTWRFNMDELAALGVSVDRVSAAEVDRPPPPGRAYNELSFAAATGAAMTFLARGEKLVALRDGAIQYRGGFVLRWPGGQADARGFRLAPHAGATDMFALDALAGDGSRLFVLDHAHYGFDASRSRLELRDMNIRLSPELAARMGHAEWAMRVVGGFHLAARAAVRTEVGAGADVCNAPWPPDSGSGQVTNIRLKLLTGDSVFSKRCMPPGGDASDPYIACPYSITDGRVVIAPDSSLVDAGDTKVPWYSKFNPDSGNVPQPPYNNDQHPLLIWNLYRIGADGGIRQLGASGVKHAFFTVNHNCSCTDHHAIFPTCEDTYSSYNNDQDAALGPRSELIPAQGIWGRCGSVYDRDCDGQWDRDAGGSPVDGAADSFDLRLVANEADLDPALNPGASYYIEYWYLVRDDANIFDSMGHRAISPFKARGMTDNAVWSFSPQSLVLGPADDEWMAPGTDNASALSSDQDTAEGHFRVSVRVTDLGDGRWRYRYVVMNFDFARAVIDPAHASEPDLKVLSNAGFDSLSVPLPFRLALQALDFGDADRDSGNDWSAQQGDHALDWQAPTDNTLDWGLLYSFTFVAPTAPQPADVTLHVATAVSGQPASYAVPSLAPAPLPDAIFDDSFEPLP